MHSTATTRAPAWLISLGLLLFGALPAGAVVFANRHGHTATLLPDGQILIVGGSGTSVFGGGLNGADSVQIDHFGTTNNSSNIFNAPSAMPDPDAAGVISRSSHTATLLPDGNVLIAGGIASNGVVRNRMIVYNTRTSAWTTVTGGALAGVMQVRRYNHTATLLKTGAVLICGGATVAAPAGAGDVTATCDVYAPQGLLGCATAGGCLEAAAPMAAPRSVHTATLVGDGRVFITGGWDPAAPINPPVLVTSEMYTPPAAPALAGGTFGAAHNLIAERYSHSATLLGNGKVLIAGGYNGRNVKNNFGFLETTEIYDPTADSIIPGAPMPWRNLGFSSVLKSAGGLTTYGGLGNVTTGFFRVPANSPTSICSNNARMGAGSVITGTVNSQTQLQITVGAGSTINCNGDFQIMASAQQQPSGQIENGFVLFSSPQVITANFNVRMATGTVGPLAFPFNNDNGVPRDASADLAGSSVFCNIPGDGSCGHVSRTLTIAGGNVRGVVDFNPLIVSGQAGAISAGTLNFGPPNPVSNATAAAPLTGGSSIAFPLVIRGLPRDYIGGTFGAGSVINVTAGNFTVRLGAPLSDRASVSLTGGQIDIAGQAVGTDPQGLGQLAFSATMTGLTGTVTGLSDQSYASGSAPSNATLGAGWAGTALYTVSPINLQSDSFDADAATITIRSMFFSDLMEYTPLTNAWAITHQLGGPSDHVGPPFFARAGHRSVLLPTGSEIFFGGIQCTLGGGFANVDVSCPSREVFFDNLAPDGVSSKLGVWTAAAGSLSTPRFDHTATVLPDKTVLVVGGSNGPNVLKSVDIYNPVTDTFVPSGNLNIARDLHTSVLLPNGRVLVAGGFATQPSTGSTASVELYFPGTKTWIQTESLKTARDNHAMLLSQDGNPLAIGGYNNGAYLSSMEVYFSTSYHWGSLASMSTARALFAAAMLQDGRIFVAGGVNSQGVLSSVEIYSPATNSWAAADPMQDNGANPIRLHSHRATLLPDGRVLVTGGNDGFGETTNSLLFDPRASAGNQWRRTAMDLNFGRFNHSAVLLPSGAVAVVGGAQGLNQSLSSVETFEIYSSSWQTTGLPAAPALTIPRAFHTTLLTSNGFLVAMGGTNSGAPLSSSERIYFEGFPDVSSVGGPPSIRQSTIGVVDVPAFDHASTVTFSGLNFRGMTEGSSGGAYNVSHHNPRITIQQLENSGGSGPQGTSSFLLDLSTRLYSTVNNGTGFIYNTTTNGNNPNGSWSIVDSSISIAMPSDNPALLTPTMGNLLPNGWYELRTSANSQFSDAFLVHSGPFLARQSVGTVAPIPVTGQAPLTVAVASDTVYWQWTCALPGVPYCPIDAGQDGFDVYYATTGVFITTVAFSTNVYVQTGLAPNSTASIIVAPFNLSGDGPLSYSVTTFTLATAPVMGAGSISSVTFASLFLTWNVNNNSQGTIYEVSESTDNPSPGGNGFQPFTTSFSTPVPTLLGLTTNFTLITGLQNNNTYFFRVRALNGLGIFSNFSAIVSTVTRTGVSQPTGQALTTYSIRWTWPDAFITAPSHYNVYNATSGFLIANAGTTPLFIETQLSTNTQNSIRVSAVTAAGEGPLSQSASAYTLSAVPGFAAPGIVNVTTGSITAIWTANQNPLGTDYLFITNNVAPLDAGVGPNFATATTQGFTAALRDLGPVNEHSPPASVLNPVVFARNGDGILSGPLSLGNTSLLAATPSNLRSIGQTPTSIAIAWDTANNVSTATYEVTFTTDNFVTNISTALPFAAKSNVTSLVVSSLITGTTYSFRVRSFDIFGTWNGSYSNIITTGTPNGGAPPGSLGGLVDPNLNVTIAGTLAGGRPISLFIPAHTFPSVVNITLSTVAASFCPNGSPFGIQITVNPPLEPLHPAFITVGYTPADVAGFTNLRQSALERVDQVTGRCVPLSTSNDLNNNRLTAEINHFSLFQIAQVIPPGTVENTLIFPNPFKPTQGDGYVTFSQVPASAHIRVYTLKGALVNEGYANASGLWLWGGTNLAGRPAASGLYLAVIQSGDQKKIYKVVVLR